MQEPCRCIAYLQGSREGKEANEAGGARTRECRVMHTRPAGQACRARHPAHRRSCRPARASSACVGSRASGGSAGTSASCCRCSCCCSSCCCCDRCCCTPRCAAHCCRTWGACRRLPGCLPASSGNWFSRMNCRSSVATACGSCHAERPRRCVAQPSIRAVATKPPRWTMACSSTVDRSRCNQMLPCTSHSPLARTVGNVHHARSTSLDEAARGKHAGAWQPAVTCKQAALPAKPSAPCPRQRGTDTDRRQRAQPQPCPPGASPAAGRPAPHPPAGLRWACGWGAAPSP